MNTRIQSILKKIVVVLLSIAVLGFAIFGIHELIRYAKTWDKNITDLDFTLPVSPLGVIEGADHFEYSTIEDINGNNYNNHVTYSWNFFAPTTYHILQRGKIPGEFNEEQGREYESNIQIKYYKMRWTALAKYYYKDLIKQHIRYKDKVVMETLDTPYFEGATYGISNDVQYLAAYRGDEVIFIVYSGGLDLRDRLDSLLPEN